MASFPPNPRRLRIAHVSLGLNFGGQEKLLVEFARLADRSRFDLHFLSLTTHGPIAADIERHGWPVTALESSGGIRPGLIWQLISFFRKHRFDVIHTHDERPLLYASLPARLVLTPRLVHTHHHGYLPQVSARQLRLTALASRFTHWFVCVSEDGQRYVISQGVPPVKTLVLRNGIDLDRFAFHGPHPSGPAVTVARLSPEKDIATLLRTAHFVRQAHPDFRLEIAGDGPQREELQRLAAELNLNEVVRFLGPVSDIPQLLARARLFVLPSKTEGVSLTLLEAMATGLPVVATRVGGNPEVVDDPHTGLLAPADNPADLAEKIEQVWSNPGLGQSLGVAGRRRVEKHFDIRAVIQDYEKLYLG